MCVLLTYIELLLVETCYVFHGDLNRNLLRLHVHSPVVNSVLFGMCFIYMTQHNDGIASWLQGGWLVTCVCSLA